MRILGPPQPLLINLFSLDQNVVLQVFPILFLWICLRVEPVVYVRDGHNLLAIGCIQQIGMKNISQRLLLLDKGHKSASFEEYIGCQKNCKVDLKPLWHWNGA